jgi:UDP-galactopyranose mutase
MNNYDILIVGAGISGCTLAERYATEKNAKVLIIDKRDHIGGNCYDFFDENGILISKYGPHYFHTNYEDVWKYVSRFTEWIPYEHRVLGHVDGKVVPIPVNITTVNKLFDLNIKTESEMQEWLEKERISIDNPKNSEEMALSLVGRRLYEKIFKGYTKKQWDKDPSELDPDVIKRIPVRLNSDDRYFTDKYQAMPKEGYTPIFESILNNKNITVITGTSWDDIKNITSYKKLFFTGRIDGYFEEKLGKLEYRSLKFDFQTIKKEYFQEAAQENYPDIDIPYTRIVEYKRATGQKHPYTVVSREYPTWEGDPYYPVPSQRNRELHKRYQEEAEKLEKEGVFFVGRLANYKYFNMDQAFKNALDFYHRLENVN